MMLGNLLPRGFTRALGSMHSRLQQSIVDEVKARHDACTCVVEDDLKQKDMPSMDNHGNDEPGMS